MINVMIADDHAIVRQGLKQILSETDDINVTGEAETGFQAIKIARQQDFDVMLLDISLPDRNGIDILKQIKKDRPNLAVLMLSMHNEHEFAIRALKATQPSLRAVDVAGRLGISLSRLQALWRGEGWRRDR